MEIADARTPAAGRIAAIQGALLSVLRTVVGFLFICHGASKLFNVLGGSLGSGKPAVPGSLLWFSGIIEFGGGILLLVGLLTQVTAFVIGVEMVIAYARVHVPRGPWPLVNRGELALVYCFLLFYMASVGGGPISLDQMIANRRRVRG